VKEISKYWQNKRERCQIPLAKEGQNKMDILFYKKPLALESKAFLIQFDFVSEDSETEAIISAFSSGKSRVEIRTCLVFSFMSFGRPLLFLVFLIIVIQKYLTRFYLCITNMSTFFLTRKTFSLVSPKITGKNLRKDIQPLRGVSSFSPEEICKFASKV
jgi:hypothetical protein